MLAEFSPLLLAPISGAINPALSAATGSHVALLPCSQCFQGPCGFWVRFLVYGPPVERLHQIMLRGLTWDFGDRFAMQLVRRITSEVSVELKILSEKWRLLLAGLVFQVQPQ